MDFYLARHGEAVPDIENPRRPLSDRGRREVERVARVLLERKVQIAEIVHSGKLRAQQTAEILAQVLTPAKGVRKTGGLSPEDDPLEAKADLETRSESLMVVGHLPHLHRLASLLVLGDSERELVEFAPAGVVCLARSGAEWELRWTLTPDSVGAGVDPGKGMF